MTTGDKLVEGVADIVTAARTLPMLATRRVVIVVQAENLLMPKRESEAATRAMEELERLIERPEREATVVFVAGAPVDKRSRLFRMLTRHATLVECGVLETAADAERWVKARAAASGAQIAPQAVRLLVERAGTDLVRLRGDVDRLLLYAMGQSSIGVDDVRAVSGPAGLQDDWAMTNAIEGGDAAEALRQVALMLDAGAPAEKVLGQLGWVVRAKFPQIAAGQVGPAVDALFRTDLDLKTSAGDSRVLLERLVVELCAGKRSRGGYGRRW